MRLILLADAFPPLRSSAAVQLHDLAHELGNQGHAVSVVLAAPEIGRPWQLEQVGAVEVLRLKTLQAKDRGRIWRALAESLMPLMLWWRWRQGPWAARRWDGVIWYSPTIFLGLFVRMLRRASRAPTYLIVRDIFPQWAADMGLMGRGLVFQYFHAVARLQYAQANVIGVQTEGNLAYFAKRVARQPGSVQVLHNWLAQRPLRACRMELGQTPLAGRKIAVYAGNMGLAQGMDVVLDLAASLRDREDVGFLLVGRGSEVQRLRVRAQSEGLCNVVFHDEIDPDEIADLYAQCHVGLLALDTRHATHNIPGKFLSYMQAGLPVLACVNPGNDIVELITQHGVGRVATQADAQVMKELAEQWLAEDEASLEERRQRCRALYRQLFTSEAAARQVAQTLAAR